MPKKEQKKSNINQSRRGFLKLSAVSAGLFAASCASIDVPKEMFENKSKLLLKGANPARLSEPLSGGVYPYGDREAVVLRTVTGELRAFDAKCTHWGCTVEFKGDRIVCPCHKGTYDFDGQVTAGPPPRGLTPLEVIEEGGKLFVSYEAPKA